LHTRRFGNRERFSITMIRSLLTLMLAVSLVGSSLLLGTPKNLSVYVHLVSHHVDELLGYAHHHEHENDSADEEFPTNISNQLCHWPGSTHSHSHRIDIGDRVPFITTSVAIVPSLSLTSLGQAWLESLNPLDIQTRILRPPKRC